MTWTLLRSPSSWPEPSLDDPKFRDYIEGRLFRISYRRRDGLNLSVEAQVVKSNPFGLLVTHGRGKQSLLLERDWIQGAQELEPPTVVTKLQVRQLGPVALTSVRQHLADRHGETLDSIPDDAAFAMTWHANMHESMKLGHKHGDTRPRREGVPTPEEVADRAAELNGEIECDSCGYRRGTSVSGVGIKVMSETEDLVCHCEDCKDDEEFTYVRQF